jgi:hypothetical protein
MTRVVRQTLSSARGAHHRPTSVSVELGCSCGAVTGVLLGVTPENSNRLSCMCDDCQIYAHFLGRPSDILDASGGTDLSYATQSRVRLLTGTENIRAVRLSPKGIFRVYTSCCNTPVAHVPSPKLAFVGIPHTFMRCADLPRDVVLGPLVHRLQGRFCRGELPVGAHLSTPTWLRVSAGLRILWNTIRGMNRPSPFHQGLELLPVVEPRVLSAQELARLRRHALAPAPPSTAGLP